MSRIYNVFEKWLNKMKTLGFWFKIWLEFEKPKWVYEH